jgi:hypothetical protein
LIQLFDQDLFILRLPGAAVFKYAGSFIGELFLPLGDLIRMDFILAGEFGDGLLTRRASMATLA